MKGFTAVKLRNKNQFLQNILKKGLLPISNIKKYKWKDLSSIEDFPV